MKFSTITALVCGAAALAACASSNGNERDRSEPVRALLSADSLMFVSFDTDGDLSTTTAEIDAGIAREFTRADTNHDGQLQPIEFENWGTAVLGGGQIGPFRLDFDRNVDNVITRAEFETEIHNRAHQYDADENGSLTRSEFVRLLNQARPVRPMNWRATPQMGSPG
jgi:hypothetical protein